jgi:hypothetical protein
MDILLQIKSDQNIIIIVQCVPQAIQEHPRFGMAEIPDV